MAELTHEGKKTEAPVKASLIKTGEKVGVAFGCTQGNCGTCLITVKKGAEHLNAPSEAEEFFGLNDGERLLCQMQIVQNAAEVEIES